LDHQTYFDAIEVERSELEILLERIFRWWLEEAMFSPGLLPEQLGPFAALPHGWTWPRHRHIDPQKQAAADHTYWEIGLLTDEEFLDRESIDPSQHYQQLEQQTERRTRLNLPQPGQADRQVVAAATKDEGDE
jgi:capsid protein